MGEPVGPSAALEIQTLVHADWSCHPKKRWAAWATREAGGWRVDAPKLVGDPKAFCDSLIEGATNGAVLAGFDFPIGVPSSYGAKTGLSDFPELLAALDQPLWECFGQVAATAEQISPQRPFYPAVPRKGVNRASLVEGHGVVEFNDLLRSCEKATDERRAACPIFWTLGGNQVGKAALDGWKTVIIPMVKRGAVIWPFSGSLMTLTAPGVVILAETYPAEAYGHVGASFRKQSKTKQVDRARQAAPILEWAAKNGVEFTSACRDQIEDGFGSDRAGEDRFDALLGLLGMIEVADQRRQEGCPDDEDILRWEGWIMGQAASD